MIFAGIKEALSADCWRWLRATFNIVWDDLGMCSPDIVGNYLQLDAKLSEFARSQVYVVDIMQNELQVIADILVLLEQELQSDAARHNNLLLETMQQD